MKKTTGEKKVGFYLVIAAALLSLVSLLVYRTVLSRLGMVYGLSVIPAIVVVMVMPYAGCIWLRGIWLVSVQPD